MASRGSLLLIAALGLGAASCQKPVSATLGQPFQLHVGQAARFRKSDLELYFRRVTADSRCPRGVECVWAGEATARLDGRILKAPPESFDVRLPGGGAPADTVHEKAFDGYWVQMVRLEPEPRAGARPDTSDYLGTFVVGMR